MANEWISERLRTLKKTKGSLAKALGVDPARVSEIIGGRRNVQVAEIPVMADMLEMSTNELVSRLVPRGGRPADRAAPAIGVLAESPAPPPHPPVSYHHLALSDSFPAHSPDLSGVSPGRTLPVYGAALGRSDGALEMSGQAADYTERPASLAGAKGAYGVYVQGESMSPRFEPGWLLYVHPGRPVRRGDNVIVQVRPQEDHQPPLAYLRVYEGRTAGRLLVRLFNPDQESDWPLEDIITVHRVVGVGEM